jgi:PKD repeat protein
MRKLIPIFILLFSFSSAKFAHAQINTGVIENGTYGQGSAIYLPLVMPVSNSCFAADNLIQLFLSDENGNFSNEIKIGENSAFYSTYINGVIPGNAVAGNNYQLRVKTTSPATTTVYTGKISIAAVAGPEVSVAPSLGSQVLSAETYGWCGSAVGSNKGIVLKPAAGSIAETLTLKNILTGAVQTYTPTAAGFSLDNLAVGYYTITVSGSVQSGAAFVRSAKTYLLLNVPSKVNVQSGGTDYGCIDPETGTGADITYSVNIDGESGIKNNYPGSSYRITWGDGKEDLITHCELMAQGGVLNHNYKKTSCGEPPIVLGNGTTVVNSFRVSVSTLNPFCQSNPASATTYPKIFSKPVAHIDPSSVKAVCINSPVRFTNKSTIGNNSDCTLQMQWKWYVDGVLAGTDEVFDYAGFNTPGMHEVKLVANNDVGLCAPTQDLIAVCVQNPPQPAFNFNSPSPLLVCAPFRLKPTNTSIIDANCNAENIYQWNVTGGTVNYENGTNANSANPEFNFAAPGIYKISLSISTASCGMVTTPEQTVVVNGTPTAILSDNVEVCNLTAYDFSNTTTGPTRAELTGTEEIKANTYTWTISGGDYVFIDGTDEHSHYPKIDFREYKTYTVTVTHQNNCGTATDSQIITFRSSAVVNAGTYAAICYNNGITLQGEITGSTNSYEWVGGQGSFSPGRNDLHAVYTPSPGEREAGRVDLILRAITSLPAPCNVVEGFTSIIIKPLNVITSNATKSICRGDAVNYTPEAMSGSVFNWLVTGSSNASGFAASGSGSSIQDVISTSNPAQPGTVTYRITPVFDSCDGRTFDLTITISPVPKANATSATNEICSGTAAGISITSSQSGLKYLWTSSTSGGQITGNTNNSTTAVSVTQINDILVNNGLVAGTVNYIITPVNEIGCTGAPINVSVRVRPAPVITNNTISGGQVLCEGKSATQLSGTVPEGGTGVYTYQWQFSTDGTNWGDIAGATGLNYNPGVLQVSTSFRRIVFVPNCAGSLEYPSNAVAVTVNYKGKAEFTFVSDKGCVPFAINSANIVATPYPDRNGTYTWFVNNVQIGQGISFPGYTIASDGESVVIKLVVSSAKGCDPGEMSHTFVSQRTTSAAFLQDIKEGCGPLTVTFVNRSVGPQNITYAWDFGNGKTSSETNPGPVTFLPDPTGKDKIYTITLIATSDCGISIPSISKVLVRSKPKSMFSPDRTTGCSPLPVYFNNTSPVATRTTYTYDFGDGSPLVSDTVRNRIFHEYRTNVTQKYTVKMFAENPCGKDSSKYEIVVSPSTTVAELVVNGTDKRGCAPFTVPFFNNSTGADAFEYDFGDGSTANTFNSPERVEHTFLKAGVFVVKLTAKGCSNAVTTDTITVLAQPEVGFTAVRNEDCNCLEVDFTNATEGGIGYVWDFGDGSSTSIEANPSHIYTAIGIYKVKLIATNINGCRSTITKNVDVTGVPGNLFLPNSFVPEDPNLELRVFSGKGSGLKSWRLSVFNKWGELMWETSKLDDGKPTEGWDGTFKGMAMPQGVYFWKADVQFLNGTGWAGMSFNGSSPKRSGIVNLIR